jgi:RNA polymerase sigma-70 factor (ECF subfamily)
MEKRLQVINWQMIVEEHGSAVWQTAYRLLGNHADAADCFQETFVCALELSRRQRIRNFRPLLARLATTRAIDQLRRRMRHSEPNGDQVRLADVQAGCPGPVQCAQDNELAGQLRESILKLPPTEAQAFCLRFLNDMSYKDIARELGIKAGAAGILLHRARAKLKDALEQAEKSKKQVAP